MKLEECLEKAGGFPFVAKSDTGDKVEFVGRHKCGSFVGWSLRDKEYSPLWSMEYGGWSIYREPLKWQGVINDYVLAPFVPDSIQVKLQNGKRFHCTLTEIVDGEG